MQPSPMSFPYSLITVAAIVAVAVAVVYVAKVFLGRLLGRRWPPAAEVAARCARPGYVVAGALAAKLALAIPTSAGADRAVTLADRLFGGVAGGAGHFLLLVLIASITWLIVQFAFVVTSAVVTEIAKEQDPGSARMRRIRTQVMLVERLISAVAVVIAVGSMLFTWPAARALGAGLLASAGIVGIIVGIAAQTAIGNLFAGLQLAFSEALHVGDVVVAENLWGEVEELTLTYVVVRVWDGRRLILPVSYFTKTPFENWTRREGRIVGTVYLRVDWRVPVGELRTHLYDILRDHPLWDGDSWDFVVTDVQPTGLVELRATMSCPDGYASWDLCCEVRERMVAYLRDHHPEALPRLRVENEAGPRPEAMSSADRPG